MNDQLFELLNREAGRFDSLDDVIEFAAQWLIYLSFAIAGILGCQALHRRQFRPLVQLGVTLVLAFGAATALAHISSQLRPFQSHPVHQLIAHDPGVSMPSDHATAAFALAFGIGTFLHRGWGVVLTVLAVVIGFARVWAGVHYPGDIAVGALIAALATAEVAVWSHWRATRPIIPGLR